MSVDFSGSHKSMDSREHERTYEGFIKATVWSLGFIILTLVIMAITLV